MIIILFSMFYISLVYLCKSSEFVRKAKANVSNFAFFGFGWPSESSKKQTRSKGLKTPFSFFQISSPLHFFVLQSSLPNALFFTCRLTPYLYSVLPISKNTLSLPAVRKKEHHIQNLILEGEHQMLDFKFEISDSRRIARSLAAFANTDGGRLLVGVKDNGAIAGVRSDEEIHMIQAAAEMYCQPKVEYTTEEWEINGKTVLEVIIPKDKHHKHKAPDNQGNYKIFVRVKDENLVADSVLIKVWKSDKFAKPAKISFTETETLLLHYLTEHEEITLQEFQQIAHINKRRAEAILADFILVGTIELVQTSQNTVFRLTQSSEND